MSSAARTGNFAGQCIYEREKTAGTEKPGARLFLHGFTGGHYTILPVIEEPCLRH